MKKATLVALILSINLPLIAAADNIKCSICGEAIEGKYARFEDGTLVCEKCLDSVPRCQFCGKPSRSNMLVDGKRVCDGCFSKLPVCDYCGQRLAGDFYRGQDGKGVICPRCYKLADRCFLCGAVSKELSRVGSKKVCRNCLGNLTVCSVCGEPISGKSYWFENDKGNRYCADCWNKFPHCASCDAPIGPRGINLADGRSLCPNCYRAAIFQPEIVTQMKLEILDFLRNELDMELMHPVEYSLQGIDVIRAKFNIGTGDLNGLFYRKGDEFSISILYGLNRKETYQVLAHEIAHAWMSERRTNEPDRKTAEGFAQWVAYHSLINFGYAKEAARLLDGDDDYASGLRMMIELESKEGRSAVFDKALGRKRN